MKIVNSIILALAIGLLTNVNVYSETIHQTVQGDAALSPDGAKALDKKLIETKTIPSNGNVVRLVGSLPQWGYVTYWFGLSAPAGKVNVRFKVYVDDSTPADFAVYVRLKSGQTNVGQLTIPTDAKKNSFVDIDVPVVESEEWNGLSLKKTAPSDKPSPWISSVSVVLP